MAKIVFGMNQSLDGYVDHLAFASSERDGKIEVAGPDLAQSLTRLCLIDEYRIYPHPVVLDQGKPYFAGPRPRLRLLGHEWTGEDVSRLTYVPA